MTTKPDEDDFEDWMEEEDFEDWMREQEEYELSPAGIAEQNAHLLNRYREFRRAADAITTAWRDHREVLAVSLIGSVARPPWKEIPRFSHYRRARIAVWHECKDMDLAVWLADLGNLNVLRRKKDKVLRELQEKGECYVASHQVDVFILEPGSDRYLGRLCRFNQCPKGKRECAVPGCGATAFLQLHENFHWQPETLAADRSTLLFDRLSGLQRRAVDLPLETGEADEDAAVTP